MLIIHSCDFHALIIHKTGNYNRHTDLFSDSFFLLTYIFRSRSRSTQLIIKLDQDPTLKYFSTKYGDAAVKITQFIVLTRCDRRADGQTEWLTQCNSSTPNFPNWDQKWNNEKRNYNVVPLFWLLVCGFNDIISFKSFLLSICHKLFPTLPLATLKWMMLQHEKMRVL